jgi:hypothetical protein
VFYNTMPRHRLPTPLDARRYPPSPPFSRDQSPRAALSNHRSRITFLESRLEQSGPIPQYFRDSG